MQNAAISINLLTSVGLQAVLSFNNVDGVLSMQCSAAVVFRPVTTSKPSNSIDTSMTRLLLCGHRLLTPSTVVLAHIRRLQPVSVSERGRRGRGDSCAP